MLHHTQAPIIDFHAHIYPKKIAHKASKNVGLFYDAPVRDHGLVSELLEKGKAIGVEKFCVYSVATKPEQVSSINNFIMEEVKKEPSFIGFASIHPEQKNMLEEIERARTQGLRGIKLHPDFQKFPADTSVLDDAYELMSNTNLILIIHAGDERYNFSNPKKIRNVLQKHPHLKIVAPHFGGYTEWDDVLRYLAGKDLWFDTSSSLWKLPTEKAKKILQVHGYERFLFGTDFPMWNHDEELAAFLNLGLSDKENRAILYENAKALLCL
jgi:hypothetical protein